MVRAIHRLSAAGVKAAEPGKYSDGGGLWLHKRKEGGAKWFVRFTTHGRRREMGHRPTPQITLREAAETAEYWRSYVGQGVISPLDLCQCISCKRGLGVARKRHSDEDILALLREMGLKLTAGGDIASSGRRSYTPEARGV